MTGGSGRPLIELPGSSRHCSSCPASRSARPSSPKPARSRSRRSSGRWPSLREQYAPGARGLIVREVAGGWTLASDPVAEPAARRLLAKPRLAALTPAQLETLAIVAYLQPVSRPEIARIRGVDADSPVASLLDRGPDRGERPLAVRGGRLPDDDALPQAVRPPVDRRASGCEPMGPESRRERDASRSPAPGRRGAGVRRAPRRRRPGRGRPAERASRPSADGLVVCATICYSCSWRREGTPPALGIALPRYAVHAPPGSGLRPTAGLARATPPRHGRKAGHGQDSIHPRASRPRGEHATPATKRPRRPNTATETARAERRAQTESATDSLQVFLNQASRYNLLTGPEEIELAKRIERGTSRPRTG